MTAQSKKIAEAIRALDVNDDALWTQDGLPRINVVAEKTGLTGLTRADLTDSGKNLDRESLRAASKPADDANGNPSREQLNEQGQPVPGQGEQVNQDEAARQGEEVAEATRNPKSDGTTGAPTENHPEESNQNPPVPVTDKAIPPVDSTDDPDAPVGDLDDQPDTSLEGPHLELKQARDVLEQRRAELNDAQDAFDKQSAEVDRLIDAVSRAEPLEKPMDSIQYYLESQKRQRQQQAARAQELREAGVNLGALSRMTNTRSPLDQAMSRKTQRGATRPGGKA